MLVDWFTVGAQILNFLILVFLLKRFLYGPVLKAMAEREERIAKAKADADARARAAEAEAAAHLSQRQELEGRREALLAEAHREAEARKQEELAQARQALASQQARWLEAVASERAAFLREVRARLARQACAVARKLARELADVELEGRMLEVFAKRLKALPPPEREALAAQLSGGGELVVSTAFAPDEAARRRVEEAARAALGPAAVRWRSAPELVGGVALDAGGRRLAWNVTDYLDGLEEHLAEVLTTEGADDGRKADPSAAA